MVQTITKNYSKNNFSEFVSDLQDAYEWNSVQVDDDGTSAIFYITESIYFELLIASGNTLCEIRKNNTSITQIGSSSYFLTKITKTSKAFCLTIFPASTGGAINPTSALHHIIIGTAVNQFTNAEETVLAYVKQPSTSSLVSGYILSSDNLTENISSVEINFMNFNSKVTTIQNLFSKYSECIMKDAYILNALQFPQLSFTDCTLNGKKYYMQGCVLLADD